MSMEKAYWKDIWRSAVKGKKRFFSIALIATLGVTMMCGLRASCEDLRYSADKFFDEQNLFDIRILSTLGLTEEDVEALESLDGVSYAEGGYNVIVYTVVDDVRKSIEIRTLSENEMNMPYLLEGEMPEEADEIVITKTYKNETGKGIGDQIVLTDKSETLKAQKYTITGVAIDTLDINSTEGSMGFRSTAATDFVGYVVPEAANSEIFSVIYLRMENLEELNCYTDEYTDKIDQIVDKIESKIKEGREQERYDEVYGEAMDEWLDGEQEMKKEFAKADAEIEDARQEMADARQKLNNAREEIEDGKKALENGEAELDSQEKKANAELTKARQEISDGYAEIDLRQDELDAGYAELISGQEQLDLAVAVLTEQEAAVKDQFTAAWKELETREKNLNAESAEYEAAKQQLEAEKAELSAQETAANEQFAEAWAAIEEKQIQLDEGFLQYQEGSEALESVKSQLAAGEKELNAQEASARKQIADGRKEIEDSWQELLAGERELLDGEQELTDGERELAENIVEYEEEKAKAKKELADALEEIKNIDMAKWYVQDRTSLSGYSNVKNDADSIQAIGNLFPILFLTVAILVSLTTITRMVEEERGLIGTYKALGFTNAEIRRKYLIYAAAACFIGGILGDIGGYIILPGIIFIIFRVMYTIPEYCFGFNVLYGFGGILLFEAGILGATIYATIKALRQMPAKLMRPKAPKSGSRVLLERITFVWKRLSFLNKVTARNLFRYKKRLMMTVFGIAGCTALLLCGFTIKDTVSEMMPQQYENIYKYDLMVVSADEDYKGLENILDEDKEISDYIPVRIESVELFNAEGEETTIQMIVVPDEEVLDGYIYLRDEDKQKVELKNDDIVLTKNATRVLELQKGETVRIQTQDLEEVETEITYIVDNYFGNVVYMTESTYKDLFGTFAINSVMAHFSEACENQKDYTDQLAREESILSATSTQAMNDEFDSAFALLNMVVYVVLVLAAMLAFVVLFTLSNTNISERERELATIKVLGFYNPEVHAYVNKETLMLSSIGILAGMPFGWALGRYIMGILELPSLEFYIDLYPQSYLYAGAITFVFTVIVNFITDRVLDKINMVEALKSVE